MTQRRLLPLVAFIILSVCVQRAAAHCQLPCGVYDDAMRIAKMKENALTIAKCNAVILDDAAPQDKKIRAVSVKEEHANDTDQIATYYFMTQRLKADAENRAAKLAALHDILLAGMACKQSTNAAAVEALNQAIDAFAALYMPAEHKH